MIVKKNEVSETSLGVRRGCNSNDSVFYKSTLFTGRFKFGKVSTRLLIGYVKLG